MAHSMGNVVAAEALRLWRVQSTAPLVDTYIAMEGAVSSGVYGTNNDDADGSSNFDLYRNWSGGTDPAAGGRPYMSDDSLPSAQWSQSAASNRVNMFNQQDVATNFAWGKSNALKPFSSNVAPSTTWNYIYTITPATGGGASTVTREDAVTHQTTVISNSLDLFDANGDPGPTAYELMALVSRANERPIGTKSVAWFNTNIDINTLGLDAMKPGLKPDIRPNHSFEFHHDEATTWGFWERVKDEIGFTSTYDSIANAGTAFPMETKLMSMNATNNNEVATRSETVSHSYLFVEYQPTLRINSQDSSYARLAPRPRYFEQDSHDLLLQSIESIYSPKDTTDSSMELIDAAFDLLLRHELKNSTDVHENLSDEAFNLVDELLGFGSHS